MKAKIKIVTGSQTDHYPPIGELLRQVEKFGEHKLYAREVMQIFVSLEFCSIDLIPRNLQIRDSEMRDKNPFSTKKLNRSAESGPFGNQ